MPPPPLKIIYRSTPPPLSSPMYSLHHESIPIPNEFVADRFVQRFTILISASMERRTCLPEDPTYADYSKLLGMVLAFGFLRRRRPSRSKQLIGSIVSDPSPPTK
jgi:hypothetical protein